VLVTGVGFIAWRPYWRPRLRCRGGVRQRARPATDVSWLWTSARPAPSIPASMTCAARCSAAPDVWAGLAIDATGRPEALSLAIRSVRRADASHGRLASCLWNAMCATSFCTSGASWARSGLDWRPPGARPDREPSVGPSALITVSTRSMTARRVLGVGTWAEQGLEVCSRRARPRDLGQRSAWSRRTR